MSSEDQFDIQLINDDLQTVKYEVEAIKDSSQAAKQVVEDDLQALRDSVKNVKEETIKELEKKYFLVSKGGFIATFIAAIFVLGGISWGTARSAITDEATRQALSVIENGAQEARKLIDGNHSLPSGAVVAVAGGNHVDDIPDICPEGWQPFEQADGRVIIGAGEATNETSLRHPMVVGGIEDLPNVEPAPHSHALIANSSAAAKRLPRAGEVIARGASVNSAGLPNENFEYELRPGRGEATLGQTSTVGSSEPLNNMQPFIAVTYCIKQNAASEN
ncbi:hypothetical protein [Parasulfitobacter algicola]|uniref:Uncharacterized protein n=1 Tax=Parasulfitobacter algicola TaxID=2614809 RepID=A0ABX2IU62_9RHOB|nr:hypothetical protein [Sulfitobacter algicola]NSX56448.1 hypothetical protein [Sulfitobacter algicola]